MQTFRAGKIEIRFVNRNHFDDGRKFREDRGDAIAPLGIFGVVTIEINRVRAEAPGSAQRHCGMHAEFSRFVGRRRDDSALVALAPDHDRFSFQRGIEEFFDGDEESVHVDVEDDAGESGLVQSGHA